MFNFCHSLANNVSDAAWERRGYVCVRVCLLPETQPWRFQCSRCPVCWTFPAVSCSASGWPHCWRRAGCPEASSLGSPAATYCTTPPWQVERETGGRRGRTHAQDVKKCKRKRKNRKILNVWSGKWQSEHLKSDSSTELAWLIMAQRQSMLELDRALLMHFFTM